jgi:hypothetical protein
MMFPKSSLPLSLLAKTTCHTPLEKWNEQASLPSTLEEYYFFESAKWPTSGTSGTAKICKASPTVRHICVVYVCMYACMHACMHACIDTCMCAYMHACVHTCASDSNACVTGTSPNDFIRENACALAANSQVLCLAEGEGRNAVFLAKLHHQVLHAIYMTKLCVLYACFIPWVRPYSPSFPI